MLQEEDSITLVRTLYSQLRTFSGTPAMLKVEVGDGGEAITTTTLPSMRPIPQHLAKSYNHVFESL